MKKGYIMFLFVCLFVFLQLPVKLVVLSEPHSFDKVYKVYKCVCMIKAVWYTLQQSIWGSWKWSTYSRLEQKQFGKGLALCYLEFFFFLLCLLPFILQRYRYMCNNFLWTCKAFTPLLPHQVNLIILRFIEHMSDFLRIDVLRLRVVNVFYIFDA